MRTKTKSKKHGFLRLYLHENPARAPLVKLLRGKTAINRFWETFHFNLIIAASKKPHHYKNVNGRIKTDVIELEPYRDGFRIRHQESRRLIFRREVPLPTHPPACWYEQDIVPEIEDIPAFYNYDE